VTTAFKVLVDGASCHGGSLTWSLPTNDAPGEWHDVTGTIEACSNGLHLTTTPVNWWKEDARVFEAEYDGDTDTEGDKIAVRRARLLREVSWDDHQVWSAGEHAVSSGRARASGSATVTASDSATVEASGSATVEASGSATVTAYGSATVEASGSATVTAYGSATVTAYGSATVEAYDSATVEAYGSATVEAYDSATVEASGSATVRASGSATVTAYGSATVEAYDSATVEASGSATVTASGSANAIRTRWHRGGYIKLSDLAVVIDRRVDGTVTFHAAPYSDEPAPSSSETGAPSDA
jgi:hypothetical protein